MRLTAMLTLLLLAGCAARKPAPARPHLVAPPRCVELLEPVELDANGAIDTTKKVAARINCTEVVNK